LNGHKLCILDIGVLVCHTKFKFTRLLLHLSSNQGSSHAMSLHYDFCIVNVKRSAEKEPAYSYHSRIITSPSDAGTSSSESEICVLVPTRPTDVDIEAATNIVKRIRSITVEEALPTHNAPCRCCQSNFILSRGKIATYLHQHAN
jgi:hypothetical protein